ncbi:MAG TPA: SDR family oxidoreductase [Candidatus Saccharimonadales bacterium]|nr:SDR family oxidoreductase [Candidatus Saccharimonadales bacterium]
MSKYLITGIAGFIGSNIARALLAQGASVRGIDNFITGKRANLEDLHGIDFIEGTIEDPATCARACEGVDYIFHEAALASVPRSVKDPVSTNSANVTGTLNLLVAARDARIRRVVYAGSSSAYGDQPTLPKREDMSPDPISPYAVSKLTCEHYMRSFTRVYGLETVTIRYFNVFGPYQDPSSQYSGVLAKFSLAMLRGSTPVIYGDGTQSRDFTFIENVVNANLLAMAAPAKKVSGRVFNVATEQRITLNDAVRSLRELTGYTGPVDHAPARTGDIAHSLADISLARAAFGYEPKVNFHEGLRRTILWYRGVAATAS